MKFLPRLCLMLMPVALLAACATTQEEAAPEAAAPVERTAPVQPPAAPIAAPDHRTHGSPLDDPNSLLSKRVIYFDFDKADIKPEFRQIIQAHAEYLISNSGTKVVLEGHTDERGTREYNIGLGERRANAVRSFFTLQGVSSAQVQSVSFGEERPVAMGSNEDSWRLNRRVEIIYR